MKYLLPLSGLLSEFKGTHGHLGNSVEPDVVGDGGDGNTNFVGHLFATSCQVLNKSEEKNLTVTKKIFTYCRTNFLKTL